MNEKVYITIFLCGLVTWLIRVVPVIIVKKFRLPAWLLHFLIFVPVAILAAIFMESLLVYHQGGWPGFNLQNVLASVPSLISAVISKNLLIIVLVGIVSMAIIRAFGLA